MYGLPRGKGRGRSNWLGLEVLSELRKARARTKVRHTFKARCAWQKLFIEKTYAKSREAKSALKNAAFDKKKTRCTAYQFCRALDHQMCLAGIPLSTFRSDVGGSVGSRPLEHGEKRVFVDTTGDAGGPGGQVGVKRRRSVIIGAGGNRYEVPRFASSLRPDLTLYGDQGGSGLPAWQFLMHKLRLRASIHWDPFHRVARGWKLALQHTNLWTYVLEGQTLLTWLHGPWQSGAWFSQMVDCMGEYVHDCAGAEEPSIACVPAYVYQLCRGRTRSGAPHRAIDRERASLFGPRSFGDCDSPASLDALGCRHPFHGHCEELVSRLVSLNALLRVVPCLRPVTTACLAIVRTHRRLQSCWLRNLCLPS